MRFGSVPLDEAEGAIAAHAVRLPDGTIRKGSRLAAQDIARLAAAGFRDIVVAQTEDGDLSEDVAALVLADAVAGVHVRPQAPFTGRANLHADRAGVLRAPPDKVDAFNAVDEAITLATVADFRPVAEGELIATVKVIPYAVAGHLVEAAAALAPGLIEVAPYRLRKVAVISTLLPGVPDKVVEKTLAVTRARLAPTGAQLCCERRTSHEVGALRQALQEVTAEGAELVIVFGASAIADRRDVIPAALEEAGGRVERLGMPVDPGNLLLLGSLGAVPVIGAPGCARSPKENGFDWVLTRLLAGIPVSGRDIARFGAGGLLTDIASRPFPRTEAETAPSRFAAVILAAGRSARMGGGINKLLADMGGMPVIRRVAEAALASRASPVIVVTGHEEARVRAALDGLDVSFVHNGAFMSGMASSLKAGIGAVPAGWAGALVVLGDMPLVEPQVMDRLMEAFSPEAGRLIVVPVAGEARGHPVLWSQRYFPELMALEGDVGARALIAGNREAVAEVEVSGAGAFLDVDTPPLLAAAQAALETPPVAPHRSRTRRMDDIPALEKKTDPV